MYRLGTIDCVVLAQSHSSLTHYIVTRPMSFLMTSKGKIDRGNFNIQLSYKPKPRFREASLYQFSTSMQFGRTVY